MHRFGPQHRTVGDRDGLQLLLERRGGWDSWSTAWDAVVGVVLPDGEEVRDVVLRDTFTDTDGNPLDVEVMWYDDNKLSVERYIDKRDWDMVEVTLDVFNEHLDGTVFDFDACRA